MFALAGCSYSTARTIVTPAEQEAIKADQAFRDATVAVRAMRPADRKLEPVLALVGTPQLRASVSDEFAGTWLDSYDEHSTIKVEQQTSQLVSAGEVAVHTCQRDLTNPVNGDGSAAATSLGTGRLDAIARTFRKRGDGVWIYTAYAADDQICKGVKP
jgi:ketosteroid isomerase-like protein